MPRRKIGWTPALTHLRVRGVGRVRLPGQPDIYFGPVGIWPSGQKKPPKSVEDAYRKVIADWLAVGGEQAPAAVEVGDSPTIGDIVAAYLIHVERNYRKRGKPTSLLSQVVGAVKPLLNLLGDLPAAEFGPRQWRAVRDAMLRESWAGETIVLYGSRLKAMFGWAAHEGMVPEDVADALHATRWFGRGVRAPLQWKPKQPVPEKDFDAALQHLPDVVQTMARVQRLTGMRPEEVCFMRAGDITDTKDGLWVYTARDDANKLSWRGVPKIVRIGPRAQKLLRPYLRAARKQGADAFLFVNHYGHPFQTRSYWWNVVEACEVAGVPRWTPSRLRHTRGSETRKKYGVEGTQAELGHLDSKMSERYTSSVLDELARKIAKESG